MMETSLLAQITKQIQQYNLNFLGLTETENGSGKHHRTGKAMFIFSSKPQSDRQVSGVTILLNKARKRNTLSGSPSLIKS